MSVDDLLEIIFVIPDDHVVGNQYIRTATRHYLKNLNQLKIQFRSNIQLRKYKVKLRNCNCDSITSCCGKSRWPTECIGYQSVIGHLSSHNIRENNQDITRPLINVHGSRLRSVPVLFTKSVRRQVANHGLVTDTIYWSMRCTKDDRDLLQPSFLKLNSKFINTTLHFHIQYYFPEFDLEVVQRSRGLALESQVGTALTKYSLDPQILLIWI